MGTTRLSREQLVEILRSIIDADRAAFADPPTAGGEVERTFHDLQLHQVELEAQNRTLLDAQGSLEESQSRYVDLYDFAPVAYATLDPAGVILEINLTGASLFGQDRVCLIGVSFLAAVRMADPAKFWNHLRRASSEVGPVVSDLQFSTAHAGEIDVQSVSTAVRDATGQVTAFRTTFTDVTERKGVERQLVVVHALERRLRAQIEAIDNAGLAVSCALARVIDGNVTEFLQVIVDQARALTGARFAALGLNADPDKPVHTWVFSGTSAEDVARIGRSQEALEMLDAVVRLGKTIRLKDLSDHPDFAAFPPRHPAMASFLGVPIRYGSEILGNLYMTNKRDGEEFSADDEQAMEMLAARVGLAMRVANLNERLQEAVLARENLLAVVAHDLRSPLAVIQLAAQMLSRAPQQQDDRRSTRKHVDTIFNAVATMNRLIQDLLQASTIEAGRFTVELAPAAVSPMVDEAVQQVAPLAAARALLVEQKVPPDLPFALCDRQRVVQVLSNLMGNAIKFTAAGVIRVGVSAPNGALVFSVSDAGCGISEKDLPRLFDRHWKGKQTECQGTGLGLYIAKGIVDAHGGRMWVESKVGVGSTFFFTLAPA